MNKNILYVVSLVLIAVAFYGGMKYDASQTASVRAGRAAQFAGAGGAGGPGGGARGGAFGNRGGAGGGFAAGQILSKDANGITIQLMSTSTASAGSAIVLLSASTTITKTTTGSPSDLTVGQQVMVTGARNSDGSINANSIQLRPKSN